MVSAGSGTGLSELLNDLNDAAEALEAKVGVDSSAVTTSHAYKLGEITGSDKAVGKTATQTMTNKTMTSPTLNTPTVNTPAFTVDWDGWIAVSDSWTYSSVSGVLGTITVPSGAASRYRKGDKVKFTQTTVKYFYIMSITDTTLVVSGGSDYALANAAISSISFSRADTPFGFPDYFLLSNGTNTVLQRFTMKGQVVSLWGWGYLEMTNADRNSKALTWGLTFSEIPTVVMGSLGETSGGAVPDTLDDFNGVMNKTYTFYANSHATTGSTAALEQRTTGSANGSVEGFSFLTIGKY